LAKRDYPHGTGAVLSFELDTDIAGVERFFDALRLIKLAANLGDSRSMAVHPASTTHCRLTPELQRAGEITEQTIRLAVGLEDVHDLWEDLDAALRYAVPTSLTVVASEVSVQGLNSTYPNPAHRRWSARVSGPRLSTPGTNRIR